MTEWLNGWMAGEALMISSTEGWLDDWEAGWMNYWFAVWLDDWITYRLDDNWW